METVRPGRSVEVEVVALDGAQRAAKRDDVVGEEPLEIRLVAGAATNTLAITMRTPGNDFELAAGFVYGEAIVRRREDLVAMDYCIDPQIDPEQRYNIVNVELSSAAEAVDISRFERHFVTSSACGVCGRAQIDSLRDLGVNRSTTTCESPRAFSTNCPNECAKDNASLQRPAGFTPRRSSTSGVPCWPCARTSAATTPSTKSSAGRCSTRAFRSRAAS